ncbi:MAG: hypothetical protein GX889_11205, partial [Clostridiales bacterium]|nr:hypothetical protein [Clostridiales bacterium]
MFGTAGYNNTKEYFDGILASVKSLFSASNTVIGSYMCQGRVSEAVKDKVKNGMLEKYEAIKDKLIEAENHPNEKD